MYLTALQEEIMDKTNPYPERTNVTEISTLDIDSEFKRFKEYPLPDDVRKFGLAGIPKVFPLTGEPISDDLIYDHMTASVADIEMTGLTINPTSFSKQDDFHDGQVLNNFFPLKVTKFPILDVETIEFVFPHSTLAGEEGEILKYSIPKHWVSWDRCKINMIASTGHLLPQMAGGQLNAPLAIWASSPYRPNAVLVHWKAGFKRDQLPVNVWRLIVDMTAFNLLSDIGPMLFPIGNMSVNIDSVGQSLNHPGHRIFEQRLASLDKRIQTGLNKISSYYGQRLSINYMGL